VSERTRLARHSPVSDCVAALPIEPALVHPGDDPLTVMREAWGHPQTRVLGVIDDDGVLVGILSIVRLAEAVIARVSPEILLADAKDLLTAGRLGTTLTARTISDVMLPPASLPADATLDAAFRLMHARHLTGVYVVDAAGRPTGYLDLLELTVRYVEALQGDRSGDA
jgi:CBS domain-containing protein